MSKSQNPVLYAYTGRQYDSESGLYYYRARSYDANSGRFMSKDPKGIGSGDLNLYRYVGNDPVSNIDPYGYESIGVDRALQEISKGFERFFRKALSDQYDINSIPRDAHDNPVRLKDFRNEPDIIDIQKEQRANDSLVFPDSYSGSGVLLREDNLFSIPGISDKNITIPCR